MLVEVKVLDKEFYGDVGLPKYQTSGSAAIDLHALECITLGPGEQKVLGTGLAIWIGKGAMDVAGVVVPRSGLGKRGLVLANTVGVIDSDYQGEVKIVAWNRTGEDVIPIQRGDRIAQLMFTPIVKPQWLMVDEFSNKTARGVGGFGSTGDYYE
jgi:dUTP pyrophosphatase